MGLSFRSAGCVKERRDENYTDKINGPTRRAANTEEACRVITNLPGWLRASEMKCCLHFDFASAFMQRRFSQTFSWMSNIDQQELSRAAYGASW